MAKVDAKKQLKKSLIKHLNRLTSNERMPYFECTVEQSQADGFPDLFIAQWNRNAFGGWFIHCDPNINSMSDIKTKWVQMTRQKGYACTVIDSLDGFKLALEDYRHSTGLVGRQHFERRYRIEQ